MKVEIKIGIEAPSEQRAAEIAKALIEIKNNLCDSDLLELARILKQNPDIVKTAKRFLR